MRYRFIEWERIHYPVTLLCQALAVPRSGYYAWRQRGESPRAIENQRRLERIRLIYTRSKKNGMVALVSMMRCNTRACGADATASHA
jgi:hypothetical protein